MKLMITKKDYPQNSLQMKKQKKEILKYFINFQAESQLAQTVKIKN